MHSLDGRNGTFSRNRVSISHSSSSTLAPPSMDITDETTAFQTILSEAYQPLRKDPKNITKRLNDKRPLWDSYTGLGLSPPDNVLVAKFYSPKFIPKR